MNERRPSGAADVPARKRTWAGRLLRILVDPWVDYVYWRLNLNDESGQPSHAKVLSTIAFFFGLGSLGVFGPVVLELCRSAAPGCAVVLTFYLAFAALVFGLSFGLVGYKAWAKSQGGGTVAALQDTAKTYAAVIERRAAAGGDHEATP